jgi:hypothetical protein
VLVHKALLKSERAESVGLGGKGGRCLSRCGCAESYVFAVGVTVGSAVPWVGAWCWLFFSRGNISTHRALTVKFKLGRLGEAVLGLRWEGDWVAFLIWMGWNSIF